MPTLNVGALSKRAHETEWLDQPHVTDQEINHLFDFHYFIDRWLIGFELILRTLDQFSASWTSGRPVTILDLWCGRGDLSYAIDGWARKKGIEVQILAVEQYGRFIQLAREHHKKTKNITFEVRNLQDPLFLQAQQFDYVISHSTLHRFNDNKTVEVLKKINLLAKRGIIVSDWLRDVRCSCWISALSKFWRGNIIKHDVPLSIRRGFTANELKKLIQDSELDYAQLGTFMASRFLISGERALVLSPSSNPSPASPELRIN